MNRDDIHSRIDELLGLLSINNSRLSLHAERLSQLDIDVLRKNCIELYEHINLLALEKKNISPAKPKVEVKKAEVKKEEVKKPEPVVEKPVPPVEVKVEKSKPQAKSKKKNEDAEMNFLFQRFNSKPIKSIAKAISLVKKFELQKSFFDGDADAYKKFIQSLDNAESREEAFEIYHKTKKSYNWDNEDLRDELKALMYRKHS